MEPSTSFLCSRSLASSHRHCFACSRTGRSLLKRRPPPQRNSIYPIGVYCVAKGRRYPDCGFLIENLGQNKSILKKRAHIPIAVGVSLEPTQQTTAEHISSIIVSTHTLQSCPFQIQPGPIPMRRRHRRTCRAMHRRRPPPPRRTLEESRRP